jgi:predicted lipid-binding transport protein (Tim44 family)
MQPARNRWLGPIAGLAAGLGIAALLSHFGMGGGFGDGLGSVLVVVLLVLAAVFVWRMLRGSRGGASVGDRMQPAYGVADAGGAGAGTGPISAYTPVPASSMPGSVAALSTPTGPSGVPADFDVAGFLRNAKVYFIRLQAAWDEKNLADIREFTTPEVYAEIRMQLDEEKGAQNHTEAITLDAELLGIETTATDYLATARFTGTIRENNGAVEPLVEVWNFAKPKDGHTGWLLAGIQQVH